MEDEKPVLVSIRAADATRKAAGSSTDSKCSQCQHPVILAPSGQRFLRSNPKAVIVCSRCYIPQPGDDPRLAADTKEIADEMRTAEPNDYRSRN